MPADRALRTTLKHFSTLVLVVAMVTVTLHVAYAFVFRNVIAVGEIHDQIETVGPGRKVRNVGAGDLRDSRTAYLVVTAAELLALPFILRATRRVLEQDDRGEVPGAARAWRGAWRGPILPKMTSDIVRATLIGVAFALLVGFLLERTGLLVAQMIDPDFRFIVDGLVRGSARAFAVPFGVVPLAMGSARAKGAPG